jgi:hypothetical protein
MSNDCYCDIITPETLQCLSAFAIMSSFVLFWNVWCSLSFLGWIAMQVCDMSSLQQVKEFATRYTSSEQPLHVLVLLPLSQNSGFSHNFWRCVWLLMLVDGCCRFLSWKSEFDLNHWNWFNYPCSGQVNNAGAAENERILSVDGCVRLFKIFDILLVWAGK